MKKTLRFALLSLVAMFSANAMAETTIGAEDNSTGWWTVFSDPYTIQPNQMLTVQFKNYSSKANAWNNFGVVLTEDDAWGTAAEYVVLRADSYGWHYGQNTIDDKTWFTSLTNNYPENFKDVMDGADVTLTVKRVSANVTLRADIKTQGGDELYEEMVLPCGDGTQNIRLYLTVDNAHIVIDDAATKLEATPGIPENIPEGTIIGAIDCSTPWWGAHSEAITIEQDKTLHMEFTNFTSGVNNYNNWVLVLTDANNAATEYLVLRADNFGWGTKYDAGVRNHFRNEDIPGMADLTGEDAINLYWSTFREEMQGAYVIMDIKREGTVMDILVGMVTKNGPIWYETFKADNFVAAEQPVAAHLTVDNCCLVIDESKTATSETTAIETVEAVKAQQAGVRYNMAGQQVGAGFKGLVIENGKKFIVK